MTVWKLVACAAGAATAGAVDAAGRRACPPCVIVPCPPGATCPLPPAPEPTDAPADPTLRVDRPATPRRF